MTVNSEATSEALAIASESISTAAVIVYSPTIQPTPEPVSTSMPTESSAATSDQAISKENFQYFVGLVGCTFLLLCAIILNQHNMLVASMTSKSKDGTLQHGSSCSESINRLLKKRAVLRPQVDGLSERERQAIKEAFAADAKAGDLSGHALAANSVKGLLRSAGLERFENALREVGIDDTDFFFDGHTLDEEILTRMVGMSKNEVLLLRQVVANAEEPRDASTSTATTSP